MEAKGLFININGEFFPKEKAVVSVFDHGLLYGDGIFEGIRVYNGIVFKLKEHIERLFCSADFIMLKIPMTEEQMMEMVIKTIVRNDLKDAYVRLVVTRGVGDLGLDPRKCPEPTVIVIADKIKLVSNEAKKKGITALITWLRRDPVDCNPRGVKSLNYMNSVLAKIEANIGNVDEAICLDRNGFVSEGVAENIFIVKKGKISITPSSSGKLQGITEDIVKGLAEQLGFLVVEKNVTPDELLSADEVFFTGTAAEIMPVREINKRVIGQGCPGPITSKLIEEFEKFTRDPANGVPISGNCAEE